LTRQRTANLSGEREWLLRSFDSFLWWQIGAGLSETFTEELEQLLLASELTLLPGIYFFNPALHLAGWALAGPPKLNYKCCPHGDLNYLFVAPLEDLAVFVSISW